MMSEAILNCRVDLENNWDDVPKTTLSPAPRTCSKCGSIMMTTMLPKSILDWDEKIAFNFKSFTILCRRQISRVQSFRDLGWIMRAQYFPITIHTREKVSNANFKYAPEDLKPGPEFLPPGPSVRGEHVWKGLRLLPSWPHPTLVV